MRIFSVVSVVLLLAASGAQATITIDMVTVGDPGNAADARFNLEPQYHHTAGYGAVGYAYNIGKYEVTAGQYTAFLNAVAATDTYDLYNTDMWNSTVSQGIARSGGGTAGDPYTYSVTDPFANRPVSIVSWGDAARFANWLANGQPTGAQNASTTEDGAYYLNGATSNEDLMAVLTHKAGALYWIPTEDEWYKAAYYKGGGLNAGYWNYPTSSIAAPGQDPADLSGNNANYGGMDLYGTTKVGEFQNSKSAYGTFDQGGNVWEWDEDIFGPYDSNGNVLSNAWRGLRGGSYQDTTAMLNAAYRNDNVPTLERMAIGFRVASPVPEPLTCLLFGGSVLGGWWFKRRRV